MNATQRILATLAGRPLDRRAVTPVLSLYGAKLTGCPLETYYRDPAAYARGQAAVHEAFRPDVLFGPFDFPSLGEAFGGELHFFADQAPNLKRPGLPSLAEWERRPLPDPATHPLLTYYPEAIRRMVAAAGGEVPVAACLPPPIDLPILIFGMEAWLELVLFDEPAARRVLDRITPWFLECARLLYAAGATFIAMPCAFVSPAILPRERTAAVMIPALTAALARIGGPVVLHHGGAPLLAHLDLLAGLPAVVGYVNDEHDNLASARRILGSEPVMFGGPQAARLAGMAVAEIMQQCAALLADRRADPHFILCNSGPDIPWPTPPENIHALRQAAEAAGGFPC